MTRRHFFKQCQLGVGGMALASLLDRDGVAAAPAEAANPLAARPPHFAAQAKSVIYLHMSGAPPQQDLFDYKPKLVEHNMQPCPDELLANQRFAFIKGHPKLLGTPYKFQQYGQSGAWISASCCPTSPTIVDDMAIIRSMYTDQFNHAPAELFLLHRHAAGRRRRRWARGSPMAWARRTRTCPASSS